MPLSPPHQPRANPWSRPVQRGGGVWNVLALVSGAAGALVLFLWFTVGVLGAALGYAQAEGRYVKSFLLAADHLRSYAESGDPEEHQAFLAAHARAAAYGEVRRLLESGTGEKRAVAVLVGTGTAPGDAADMVGLFPYFNTVPSLRPAMAAWEDADSLTSDLAARGERTHAAARAGQAGPALSGEVGPRLSRLTGEIEALGTLFADILAATSRAVRAAIVWGAVGLAVILVFLAVWPARRLSHQLRESGSRFRQLVSNASDVVTVVDADGSILYVSPSSQTIVGSDPDNLVGSVALAHIHPDDRPRVVEAFRQALGQRGLSPSVQYRWRRGDGTWTLLEGTVANLLNDPVVRGVVFNARDVGDRERAAVDRAARVAAERVAALARSAEEEAQVARREAEGARIEAERLARLQSAFLSNMSHEIRTPLTAVLGSAELLDDEVPDDLREFTGILLSGGRRLMETLNAVLDLAQIEAGRMTPTPRPTDVRRLLWNAADDVRPMARAKGLSVVVEVASDVPEAIVLDPVLLDRAVVNLLGNASKFTEAGGIAVRARCERAPSAGSHQAGELHVEVEDTGVGIASDHLPYLFDEFHQASDGDARTHEGNGLGLALVRRVTELVGGRVTVESALGAGTRFRVTVPVSFAEPGLPVSVPLSES